MEKIQCLYVENRFQRVNKCLQQRVKVFIKVENICFDKAVDVLWTGDDGVCHVAPARFDSSLDGGPEYWQLSLLFIESKVDSISLPGTIRFGVRFRALGNEYWDNNQGENYLSLANSGVCLMPALSVLSIEHTQQLQVEQKFLPVQVAVAPSLAAEKVVIHWTIDNWQTIRHTPCHPEKSTRKLHGKADAAELWKGRLNLKNVFRLQYYVACHTDDGVIWDNNFGCNYISRHKALNILILNLHCYQEEQQDQKFSQIAKAIHELNADIICLQEVAEFWNNGEGDWSSNSARIINDRLPAPFHIYADWSHLGFDKYREGVAILSRYPMSDHDARYVSESHDVYSIHSRKVISAKIRVPGIGNIAVYSAHLSWWEDGFEDQFNRLGAWATKRHSSNVQATFLCGDFNIAAGSQGYALVVNGNQYEDQLLSVKAESVFEKIFRVNDPHWRHYLAEDYRIDYIFLNKASYLKAVSGDVVFTEQDYGRVSDHCGYIMAFEPKIC